VDIDKPNHLEQTADIVAAYLANHSASPESIPDLIRAVHAAIGQLGEPSAPLPTATPALTSAQIRKSITPDYLVSFEDGKNYKTLRRHLGVHGLQPETYRAKWGLPADYPMVAPNYAAQRSKLAKKMGLGVNRSAVAAAPAIVEAPPAPPTPPAKRKTLSLWGKK